MRLIQSQLQSRFGFRDSQNYYVVAAIVVLNIYLKPCYSLFWQYFDIFLINVLRTTLSNFPLRTTVQNHGRGDLSLVLSLNIDHHFCFHEPGFGVLKMKYCCLLFNIVMWMIFFYFLFSIIVFFWVYVRFQIGEIEHPLII